MIYLDYAASSPVDLEVLDKFYYITKTYFANPNSIHNLGIEAKRLIDNSTKNIAKNLKVKENEIIYTSGASESNNLVIKGLLERYSNRGKHIILSSLEHNSIISAATIMQEKGFEIDILPLKQDGMVDIDELKDLIRDDTILVSIAAVDSEIGIKQPIEEIGKILKEYPNCFFHTDATQAFGKINIDYSNVDLITINPHKFYGLNGISILVKKEQVNLKPQISGGKSTTIYRSGTPNTASIVACDVAVNKALKYLDIRYQYVLELNKIIMNKLNEYKNIHINSTCNSIPFIINISLKNVKALDLVKKLEENNVYISAKISCCPTETPSKLVYSLTKDKSLATSSVRISLSHLTKKEEVDEFLEIFDKCYKELENGNI